MFEPKFFFGTVEDRDDPLKLGRIRVRVDGIHSQDKHDIPTDSLPWSTVMQWIQSAAKDGIGWSPVGAVVGTRVFGFFVDGEDAQIPIVIGTLAGETGHLEFTPPSNPQPSKSKSTPRKAKQTSKPSPKAASKLGDTAGQSKAAVVAKRLQERYGLTDYQAAGLVGNLQHESSGLVSNIKEGGKRGEPWEYGTTLKGYGWAQWTNPKNAKPGAGRLDKYLDFTKSKGLDPQSDEANYQFLVHELDTTHKSTITAVKKTTSLEESTESVMNVFERPNKKFRFLERRVGLASKTLRSMSNVNVPVRTTGADDNAEETAPDDQPEAQVDVDEAPESVQKIEEYHGVYPYNKTLRSESGHLIEIDDTPQRERLLWYHKTGTFHEMRANGDDVVKVVGDKYEVVVGNHTITVKGDIKIVVDGNATITAYNDVSLNAAGTIKIKSAEDVDIESGGDINLKAEGNINADGSKIKLNSGAAADTGLSDLERKSEDDDA